LVYYQGGIGEAVCSAVAELGEFKVYRLAVPRVPQSGPSTILLEMYGISASAIVKKVKEMLA
jgi:transketolase